MLTDKQKQYHKLFMRKWRENNQHYKEYAKEWRKNHKEKVRISNNKAMILYRSKHPERKRAWNAVERALKSGKLIRPHKCECCGIDCKPEAHHRIYDDAHLLDVQWLCRTCHRERTNYC